MLVHGGRSWVRLVSLVGSIGAVGLVSMAGCGGRTSTLDPDVYGPGFGAGGDPTVDTPTPIGIAGKPSSAGTSSTIGVSGTGTGAGGTPSKPVPTTGGKGGAGALDPSLAVTPCQKYCPGYVADCSAKLMPGQDCLASCEGEVNGWGVACQKLGISALKCLAPFLKPGLDCDTALARGLATCGKTVASFQKCKGPPTPTPTPTPTPMPTPTPTPIPPMPIVNVGLCPSMGDSGNFPECKALFSCPNGQFETYCQNDPQTGASNCTCLGPQGQMAQATFHTPSDPCHAAAQICVQ